jgi:hypothetical protein
MWLETVVLVSKDGYGARLRRMLKVRSLLRKESPGCARSWVGESANTAGTFLLQALYENEDAIGVAMRSVSELDEKDGGLEVVLNGPPLVGIFVVDDEDF